MSKMTSAPYSTTANALDQYLAATEYIRDWNKPVNVIQTMYMLLAVSDMSSGIACLLHAVVQLLMVTQERTIFPFFVPTVYFISTLVIRTTIVFNVALAGLRTLNIVRPFHRVKRWPLVVTIVVYISFWIAVIGYHVYKNVGQGLYFTLMNQHLVPIVGYDLIRWVTGSVEFRDHVLISMGVSFAIPTLFTMVFVTIQANSLLKRKRNVGQTAQNRKEDRHVTGTILLITTIFTINNIIYLVWILHYINTDHIPVMWNYFLSSTCQFLTSFLNPLMIILRSTNLKQGVRDKMSPVMASRESTVVTNAVAVARSPTRMPKESYM